MKKSFLLALATSPMVPVLMSSPAFAGCKPECKAPEVCRYEAAGNKFYCAAPKKTGVSGGGITGPGSVNRETIKMQ